jgi:uncharacterized protein YprB with RNaseH-like and TPR domain
LSEDEVRIRLARLLRVPRGARSQAADVPEAVAVVRERLRARERRAGPPDTLAPVGLEPESGGAVLARRVAFDADHRHGEWRLGEGAGADPRVFAQLCRDPALASLELSRALYLDTETSGLSGGAGTWVFLVGLGRFDAGRFEIWQGFLADPGAERALLLEAAARIRAASAVVSFFGKSFDRHRLEDKMRLHGIEPPFAGKAHLDLYHPLRRLYRAALEDARLKTLERELCGVARQDDLPGSRAPAAWFDFLHGRPHELEGVFRHNRDDVLSLVTLAAHLSRTLFETRADGSPLSGPAAARARAVAKVLVEAREHRQALAWFDRAVERGGGSIPADHARLWERARRRAGAGAAP